MKWFISDLHLFSPITIKDYVRPFSSVSEEYETLLRNINNRVRQTDDLYIIGDYFDYSPDRTMSYMEAYEVIRSFNGIKHLIMGNNEVRLVNDKFEGIIPFKEWCLQGGFSSVTELVRKIKIKGNDFYLVHDPSDCSRDLLSVYGHLHLAGAVSSVGFNVACDTISFRPISEDELYTIMDLYINYMYGRKSTYTVMSRGNLLQWKDYWKHKAR